MHASVVIPTYNRGSVLLEAVESVLRQTYQDLEIIIVDDGSSDDTAAGVRQLTRDPRLRFYRFDNAGVAVARNRGVGLSRGDVVAFLDSDDLWKADKLKTDVDFLDSHPDAAAVFTDLEKIHGCQTIPSFVREAPAFAAILEKMGGAPSRVLERDEMLACLLKDVPIKPSAFSIRTPVFRRLRGFDESLRVSEDWDFFLRLARDFRLGYVDRPLSVLRISPDSVHLLEAEQGLEAAWRFLLTARRALKEPQLRAAASEGLADVSKHLGWYHLLHGRRLRASATQLRGFLWTGEPRLLFRSLYSLVCRQG
jgi:hypothetical protein